MEQKGHGLTLIEWLMILSIGVLLLTWAVPSYYAAIQNNRVISITNQLSASFHLARMEAVKRGVQISVCPAADGTLSRCGTVSQWSQGWIVFTDPDRNQAIDALTDRLKVQEALSPSMGLSANGNIVSYDGMGFLTSPPFTITIRATGCTGQHARVLSISSGGLISIRSVLC